MRLTEPLTLRTIALYTLPILVAWLGLGVFGAVFCLLLITAATMAAGMRGLFDPPDPNLLELHTITYSHYVEKARWCLDRTGLAYTEVPSVGILGLVLSARTVPTLFIPVSKTSIGDSAQILRYLWGAYSGTPAADRVRFLEPTPERLELERHFDVDLGVPIRLWSYWHLLERPDLTLLMWGHEEPTIPSWQRSLLPYLRPVLAEVVRRSLGVDAARADAGLEQTKKVFAEVDAMLADGRRYLCGDRLTFVDITFASLAALALFPDGYAGERSSVRALPMDRLSPEWRREVDALRATAAGQYVLRLYAEERSTRAQA